MTHCLLVLCTCPDNQTAQRISNKLLSERLSACVNILPSIMSQFIWDDKIEASEEILLMIKTTESLYQALEKAIQSVHPYEVPEVIALPISKGAKNYLEWMIASVKD